MKILDDIKAKRENVQNSQYCESCDNSLYDMPCTCFETIEHNAAYAVRMDPKTVEAMENVCRAAGLLKDTKFYGLSTWQLKAVQRIREALKALGGVDEIV